MTSESHSIFYCMSSSFTSINQEIFRLLVIYDTPLTKKMSILWKCIVNQSFPKNIYFLLILSKFKMPAQSQTCYSKLYPSYPCHKCECYIGNLSRALESNTKFPPAKLSYKYSSSLHEEPVCKAVVSNLDTDTQPELFKYLSSGLQPDREFGLGMVSAYKL